MLYICVLLSSFLFAAIGQCCCCRAEVHWRRAGRTKESPIKTVRIIHTERGDTVSKRAVPIDYHSRSHLDLHWWWPVVGVFLRLGPCRRRLCHYWGAWGLFGHLSPRIWEALVEPPGLLAPVVVLGAALLKPRAL